MHTMAYSEEFENRVQTYCKATIASPIRSNYVKTEVMAKAHLFANMELSHQIRTRRIRFVLQDAEWAEKWGQYTYKLDPAGLDAEIEDGEPRDPDQR